ncbi:MAG: hypothetical protein IKI99_05065 [Firmicutes bacterium]|nr:hypothetical protein [Bacillota bacterium]
MGNQRIIHGKEGNIPERKQDSLQAQRQRRENRQNHHILPIHFHTQENRRKESPKQHGHAVAEQF